MNNLKTTEKLMMLSSRRKNVDYQLAFMQVVNVYRHIDETGSSNHCKILRLLYDVTKRTKTLLRIAKLADTSDNALRRYRTEYVSWFLYFLKLGQASIA